MKKSIQITDDEAKVLDRAGSILRRVRGELKPTPRALYMYVGEDWHTVGGTTWTGDRVEARLESVSASLRQLAAPLTRKQ